MFIGTQSKEAKERPGKSKQPRESYGKDKIKLMISRVTNANGTSPPTLRQRRREMRRRMKEMRSNRRREQKNHLAYPKRSGDKLRPSSLHLGFLVFMFALLVYDGMCFALAGLLLCRIFFFRI